MTLDVARLFEEHNRPLLRYLEKLTGDSVVAADAVQHAFLRMLERPPDDDNPKAWLYRVATNAAWDRLEKDTRRKRLLSEKTDRVPVPKPEPPADRELDRDAARREVRAALGRLSEKERTILVMRAEGFRHREIAEAVGTTTASVGTMIARALERLAQHLELDDEERA